MEGWYDSELRSQKTGLNVPSSSVELVFSVAIFLVLHSAIFTWKASLASPSHNPRSSPLVIMPGPHQLTDWFPRMQNADGCFVREGTVEAWMMLRLLGETRRWERARGMERPLWAVYWQGSVCPMKSCSRFVPGVLSLSISEAGPLKSRRCGTVECYLTTIKRRQNSRRARQARDLSQPKNPSWMPSVLLLPPEPIKQEPQSSSSLPDSLVLYESHATQCLWYLATRQIRLSLLDPHNLQTQHHPP